MKLFAKSTLVLAALAAPFLINTQAWAQASVASNSISSSQYLGTSAASPFSDVIIRWAGNEVARFVSNGGFQQGSGTTASGQNGAAFNYQTTASGTHSAAFNYQCVASGDLTFAANGATTAQSYEQAAFGRFNAPFGSASSWVATDPLFQVGNGTGGGALGADALRVLKNGNTTVSGTFTSSSDARLKTDIAPLGSTLAKLDAVQPVYFKFLDTERHPEGRQLGFIAQEIEKQWPELVLRDNNGYLSVAYGNMSAVAIQAIKEQQEIIKSQDARIARLEAAIQQLIGGTGSGAKLGMLETKADH